MMGVMVVMTGADNSSFCETTPLTCKYSGNHLLTWWVMGGWYLFLPPPFKPNPQDLRCCLQILSHLLFFVELPFMPSPPFEITQGQL